MPVEVNYQALPTIGAFHASNALVKGIRGPEGSGKTVGCCFEIFRRSILQEPYKGVRYSKWAMVRNTYPELLGTTLDTWLDWFGDFCETRRSPPIESHMRLPWKDGTEIDLQLQFLALDIPADVKKIKGLEVTGTFINEAVEVGRWVLTRCFARRGRYPKNEWGGATLPGVIMDTNSCDDDHWWYKASEEEKNQGWEFFDQPAALLKFVASQGKTASDALNEYWAQNTLYPEMLKVKVVRDLEGSLYIPNPIAENIENLKLGFDYYLDAVPGKPVGETAVFFLNEYGTVTDSKPVYPEYMDGVHCAKEELKAVEGIGITLGLDFGRTPACTLAQISPAGQKLVIEEHLVEEHGSMGIRSFSRDVLVPHLLENYLPWLRQGIVKAYGDPAGKGREQTDEKTCFMVLNECPVTNPNGGFPDYKANAERLNDESWVKRIKKLAKEGKVSLGDIGIQARPARTNSYEARRDAVAKLLMARPDGNPAILISSACKYLRKGMRGKYMYKRVQVSGEARYKDEPDKNIYSHISEGLQYDCLESSYITADTTEHDRKKEQELRNEIGNASCSAWDELREIREQIEQGEYYPEEQGAYY